MRRRPPLAILVVISTLLAQAPPPAQQPAPGAGFQLNLTGATLQEVIDILARQLKMNYILDPAVRGSVTINTYGELQLPDVMPLLETILRMNGFVAVKKAATRAVYREVGKGEVEVRSENPLKASKKAAAGKA